MFFLASSSLSCTAGNVIVYIIVYEYYSVIEFDWIIGLLMLHQRTFAFVADDWMKYFWT